MESFIVAIFKDVQHANEGLGKLKELDQLDEIVIYNMAMVRKKGDHQFEYLYHDGPDTQDLPAEGAVIGSLVGLIAGPIGMAIGRMTRMTSPMRSRTGLTISSGQANMPSLPMPKKTSNY